MPHMPPLQLTNLLHTTLPYLSVDGRALLSALGCVNGRPTSISDLAQWLGFHDRYQLARALRREGLPPMETLGGWTRTLYWIIESQTSGVTLRELARRERLDPAVAYRLVRRITGRRWSDISHAGLPEALLSFRDHCRGRASAAQIRQATAQPGPMRRLPLARHVLPSAPEINRPCQSPPSFSMRPASNARSPSDRCPPERYRARMGSAATSRVSFPRRLTLSICEQGGRSLQSVSADTRWERFSPATARRYTSPLTATASWRSRSRDNAWSRTSRFRMEVRSCACTRRDGACTRRDGAAASSRKSMCRRCGCCARSSSAAPCRTWPSRPMARPCMRPTKRAGSTSCICRPASGAACSRSRLPRSDWR